MQLSGKRGEYTSLVVAQAYFLNRLSADVVYAKPFGFTYGLDIVFATASTVLWAAALTNRLARCGLSRWWALAYGMPVLAACVAVPLRKPSPTEIAIATIAWVGVQLPLLLLRDKPEALIEDE